MKITHNLIDVGDEISGSLTLAIHPRQLLFGGWFDRDEDFTSACVFFGPFTIDYDKAHNQKSPSRS